jgi:PfaB family protein
VRALGGAQETLWVTEAPTAQPRVVSVATSPRLRVYAGADREAVRTALLAGAESTAGAVRLALLTPSEDFTEQRAYAVRLLSGDSAGGAQAQQATGVYFRERPMEGELAFVFTMAAAAYPAMGRELLLSLPQLADGAQARFPALGGMAERIYRTSAQTAGDNAVDLMAQLESYSFLCQIHVELSRQVLGLLPQAAIGLCTGESSALFALGAWRDMAEMFSEIGASGLYTKELGGELAAVRRAWLKAGHDEEVAWASWRILWPVSAVLEAAQAEPLAHVTLIHSPADCVLSGHPAACERALSRLGPEAGRRTRQIDGAMAIHCPEVAEFADTWLAIHRRSTWPVPGVRFYTHSTCDSYAPDSNRAAEALLGQAMRPVDFPRLIERAWQDGVRVFVEHGPRGLCSDWIAQILGNREHLAVSMDAVGRPGLLPVLQATAQLFVAGVPVNHYALNSRHLISSQVAAEPARELQFSAHRPAVRTADRSPSAAPSRPPAPAHRLPEVDDSLPQLMVPAPPLPPPNLRTLAAAASAARPPEVELISQLTTELVSRSTAEVVREQSVGAEVIDNPLGWAMMQAGQGMIEQHSQFLDMQAALHAEFLAARQRALQVLLAVRSGERAVPEQAPPPSLNPVSATLLSATSIAVAPIAAPSMVAPLFPPSPAASVPAVAHSAPPVQAAPALMSAGAISSVPAPLVRPGPKFSRAELEILASGEISSIFGPQFRGQDGFRRQVRMPMPPL